MELLSSSDMNTPIDRRSPLPFYHQLKERILEDIHDRGLQPGDRVPGDHELSSTYDVSRTVVRQALAELESEGVVERIKGRGTFVAPKKRAESLVQSLTGLFEDVAASGSHLHSDVRRLEIEPADEATATELEVEPGTPVIVVDRLRCIDEVPWVITVTHLPADRFPGLVDEDLRDQSLYALLENKYGQRLLRGRRSVEAAVATPAVAKELGIPRGSAVLVLRSVSRGLDERPLESFVAIHRGDRSRFEVELERGSSAPQVPLMHVTN